MKNYKLLAMIISFHGAYEFPFINNYTLLRHHWYIGYYRRVVNTSIMVYRCAMRATIHASLLLPLRLSQLFPEVQNAAGLTPQIGLGGHAPRAALGPDESVDLLLFVQHAAVQPGDFGVVGQILIVRPVSRQRLGPCL